MHRILPTLLLLFATATLAAQFDTIAGPYIVATAVTLDKDQAYMTANFGFSPTIYSLPIEGEERFGEQLFRNPSGAATGRTLLLGNDLYVLAFNQPLFTSTIYRVVDVNGPDAVTEAYLTVPGPVTALVENDSVFYIASGFPFFLRQILRYDMRTPEIEPEVLVEEGFRGAIDMVFWNNNLLISDQPIDNSGIGRIARIDLSQQRPVVQDFINNVDGNQGMTVEGDLLYMAVFNRNSNERSGVQIYELEGTSARLRETVGQETAEFIVDVERKDGCTYIVEQASEDGNSGGYLLRLEKTVGVDRSPVEAEVGVYPNPATDRVNFPGVSPTEVQLYDVTGRLLRQYAAPGNFISVAGLPRGNYQLLLRLADGSWARSRVVKW